MEKYKLSEVCRLVGVTRRALQGYDEIGLLKHTDETPAGYWLYDDQALNKLVLIQIFVEIGYSRSHIKEILNKSDLDLDKEYTVAIESLQHKKERIDQMIGCLEAYKKIFSLPSSVTQQLTRIDVKKIFRNASFAELQRKSMERFSQKEALNGDEIQQEIRVGLALMEIGCLNGEDPASPEVQEVVESLLNTIIDLTEEHDQNIFSDGKDRIPNDVLRLVFAKSISLATDEILADKDFQEWTTICCGDGAAEFVVKAVEAYCELHIMEITEKYEIDLDDLGLEGPDV